MFATRMDPWGVLCHSNDMQAGMEVPYFTNHEQLNNRPPHHSMTYPHHYIISLLRDQPQQQFTTYYCRSHNDRNIIDNYSS